MLIGHLVTIAASITAASAHYLQFAHQQSKAASQYPVKTCQSSGDYSCASSSSSSEDTCCYENYGIIMQTQFWDFNEDYLDQVKSAQGDSVKLRQLQLEINRNNTKLAKRAASSDVSQVFTIHGLWDDLCDGSYKANCDPSLEIGSSDNLTKIIRDDFNKPQLYDTMTKYWVNNEKSNVANAGSIELWEHEWNKHGTCFNTIKPSCFTGTYKHFENAVYFFQKVVEVWQGLPTYQFLQKSGIVPTVSKQYKLSDVKSALAKNHGGKEVYVGCKSGAIDEIWYYHVVKGNAFTGDYKPVDSLGKDSCGEEVWYLPK